MITDKLSPEELALLTNIIAIEICKGKSIGDIVMLATIYSSIASQMILISAQMEYINKIDPINIKNTSVISTKGAANRGTKK